jgi:hypothetical protein
LVLAEDHKLRTGRIWLQRKKDRNK